MIEIAAARPDEWTRAVHLFCQHAPEEVRAVRIANALTLLASGDIDPIGLLVARQDARLMGVQVAALLPGNTGLLWPPQTAHDDTELENRLIQAGLAFLRRRGATLAQAFVPESADAAAFIRAGLTPLTRLVHLHHPLNDLRAFVEPAWQNLPHFSDPPRFQETLLATYRDTRDCPELDGVRNVDEIIAGHRAQGRFRPDLWRLFLLEGQPLGVVLLNPLKDEPAWDLSYIGVVPARRRAGWGKALLGWALHAARQDQALELQLAVDARNEPALRLYREAGFIERWRESVLFALLHTVAGV